jgi:hypothetical protein
MYIITRPIIQISIPVLWILVCAACPQLTVNVNTNAAVRYAPFTRAASASTCPIRSQSDYDSYYPVSLQHPTIPIPIPISKSLSTPCRAPRPDPTEGPSNYYYLQGLKSHQTLLTPHPTASNVCVCISICIWAPVANLYWNGCKWCLMLDDHNLIDNARQRNGLFFPTASVRVASAGVRPVLLRHSKLGNHLP